jgi:multidrug efflux pump subunit AcrB
VLFNNEKAYLFVVRDGKAQRRDVKTGFADADVVEILSGIRAVEQVVVTGNYELEDGMPVNVSQPAMTAWLAAHRWSVLFLITIAALGGLIAAFALPVALVPDDRLPRIAIPEE